MITKEEYLKALKLIEEYRKQIKKEYESICKEERVDKSKSLSGLGLTKGDYIIYIGGSESKYLTKGQKYKLFREPKNGYVFIKNDGGNRVALRDHLFSINAL
jgi:hypothetical protein